MVLFNSLLVIIIINLGLVISLNLLRMILNRVAALVFQEEEEHCLEIIPNNNNLINSLSSSKEVYLANNNKQVHCLAHQPK